MDAVLKNSPANETCFLASCESDNTSSGGVNFDPFTNFWAGLMSYQDPNLGDVNKPHSAQLAFKNLQLASNNIKDGDTPVIGGNPPECVNTMVLGLPDLVK